MPLLFWVVRFELVLTMYTVQFSPCRVVEYSDTQKIQQRVVKWLLLREAENAYLLGNMREICQTLAAPSGPRSRVFALEDEGAVLGVAALSAEGCLVLSWMTPAMMQLLANYLVETKCSIHLVYGPAHESWRFAREWAQRTGQRWEMGPEERIYQLMRVREPALTSGHFAPARAASRGLLVSWMAGFVQATHYPDSRPEYLVDTLLGQQRLFVWMDPQPVAMAAWTMPTPAGACINFVYTPPESRGRGYAKAVVASLARHMLASGMEYCFIFTDTTDRQTNSLYQAVGARTLCEFMRCAIKPAVVPTPSSAVAFSL